MTHTLPIEIALLRPGAALPTRQTEHATGYDLHACLDGGTLEVGASPVLVPTGIAIAAPPGVDVQIRPRSGLFARGVVAGLGTLDPDYRGEVFVAMYCLPSTGSYTIRDGERVAQLVVSQAVDFEWRAVGELGATARGAGGHGSTGQL